MASCCSGAAAGGGSRPGERAETLEAPSAGVVHVVRPGSEVTIRSVANAIPGRFVLAGPTWGRLQVATGADGELRAQHVDVGAAGAIIVAGARMDAEALTRARAVGIRGVIVAALGIKEQRDFLASERRGRAAIHGLPPFAILVLDGAARRPIASPRDGHVRGHRGRHGRRSSAIPRRSSSTIRASRCRRRPPISSACGPARWPAPRARGRDSPVPAASRPASRSRRRSSGSAAARRSRSRSATSSALPDARVTIATTGTAAALDLTSASPDETRSIARGASRRSPRRATCCACGASSGRARRSSPRASGRASACATRSARRASC